MYGSYGAFAEIVVYYVVTVNSAAPGAHACYYQGVTFVDSYNVRCMYHKRRKISMVGGAQYIIAREMRAKIFRPRPLLQDRRMHPRVSR